MKLQPRLAQARRLRDCTGDEIKDSPCFTRSNFGLRETCPRFLTRQYLALRGKQSPHPKMGTIARLLLATESMLGRTRIANPLASECMCR